MVSMVLKLPTDQLKRAENLNAERQRMEAILNQLNGVFKPWRLREKDPFLLLVGTVLSQNTNDRNSFAAFKSLTSRFTTPEQIASASLREIGKLIKIGGLYREKAKRLKEISKLVWKKYGGNMNLILQKPAVEARRELLSLPGVGPKTADVVLAFGAGHDVFPVDTHVFRVSKRLGFAEPKDGYEEVKRKLERVTPPGRRIEGHVLLIQLGRNYCRSRNPNHKECPINRFCPVGTRYAGPSLPLRRRAHQP
jgi:endonuclease-3